MSLSSLPYSKLNPATSDIFFGVNLKWVHCLALKHITFVALEMLLNLSEPQFSCMHNVDNKVYLPSKFVYGLEILLTLHTCHVVDSQLSTSLH